MKSPRRKSGIFFVSEFAQPTPGGDFVWRYKVLELNILCSQPTKIFQMQVPTVDGVGCLAKYPKKKFGYHEISCIFVLINY